MPEIKRQSLLTVTSEYNGIREWYFAFCPNFGSLPWWQRWFLRNDPEHLHHVYAFCQVGDHVLFVEPSQDRIDFTVKHNEAGGKLCAAELAKELAGHGHVVLFHRFIPELCSKKCLFNFVPTCVTIVKVASGYPSLAITPKHLLHCLIKQGAKVVLLTDHTNAGEP